MAKACRLLAAAAIARSLCRLRGWSLGIRVWGLELWDHDDGLEF